MQKEKYPYESDIANARFEFDSIGPNGIIRKTIDYKKVGTWRDGLHVYNLAFGDWDEENNSINDHQGQIIMIVTKYWQLLQVL